MTGTTDRAERRRRWRWFALLYLGGLAATAALAYGIRFLFWL